MANTMDGRYDYTKPWAQPAIAQPAQPRWAYNGPFSSNMERLTTQALMAAAMPGIDLQQVVRPPMPQIQLFPKRFGWGERTQPTMDDVVSVDRVYMEPRVSWYSGSPAGYSGTSRNSLESI